MQFLFMKDVVFSDTTIIRQWYENKLCNAANSGLPIKKEMIKITEKQIIGAVHNSMYHQIKRRGYAAPVDVLIDCGVLPKKVYEEWRFGRVPFLEKGCTVNLKKLSFIMHHIRVYAQKNKLKPSVCVYKRWGVKKKGGQGHKPVILLRFSRSGDNKIEQWYSTHYLDIEKINQLKAGANDKLQSTTE